MSLVGKLDLAWGRPRVLIQWVLMGKRRDILPGIGYMLVGGVMMSIQGLGVRIVKTNVSIEGIIFSRFLICLLLSLFIHFIVQSGKVGWSFVNVKLLIIRSLVAFVSLVICFFSIQFYNSGLVFVLFFSTPLFLPFIAKVWLGIPIVHRLWLGLIIALIGIVCVIDPFAQSLQPGLLVVLIATILAGISVISIRVLHKTDSTKTINFVYFTVAFIGSIFLVLFSKKPTIVSFDMTTLFLLIVTGITGYLFQLFTTQAFKYAPSRVLSPFSYSSSIFSLFIDSIFFGLTPSFIAIMGVLLVILGTVINVLLFPSEHITRLGK